MSAEFHAFVQSLSNRFSEEKEASELSKMFQKCYDVAQQYESMLNPHSEAEELNMIQKTKASLKTPQNITAIGLLKRTQTQNDEWFQKTVAKSSLLLKESIQKLDREADLMCMRLKDSEDFLEFIGICQTMYINVEDALEHMRSLVKLEIGITNDDILVCDGVLEKLDKLIAMASNLEALASSNALISKALDCSYE